MSNLAALLEKEASAEIQAILSEAQKRASELVAKAQDEAKLLIAQRERALASQHDAAIVRAKSSAQLEAASLKLRAQNDKVETVYAKVEEELKALMKNPEKYKAVLAALLKEATAAVGNLATVVVNPADEALVEVKGAKLETAASVVGGVRVRGVASNVTVENTLSGRLSALREELASEVSKALLNEAG